MPRSSWIFLVLLMATLLAAVYVLLYQGPPDPAALQVAEVPEGDQEIAWLHPATTPYSWERFVAGLQYLARRRADWQLTVDVRGAFPSATTAVASVGIRRSGYRGVLWFRWYKLTGQHGQAAWLERLAARKPPPLAIVGGGSSDRARDLAEWLEQHRRQSSYAPPLLITTATADSVFTAKQEEKPLLDLYPGRAFRCCFSNRQMAEATLDFVFSQPDLRPTQSPIFLAFWEDDPYSRDFMDQCRDLLWHWQSDPQQSLLRRRGSPGDVTFVQIPIRHSIGPVNEPNPPESLAVQKLVEELTQTDREQRALLILPGEIKPVRRLLRALVRAAPTVASRLIVATGDAVDFNAIFRDRHLAWPLQELPCQLVLFCHRDPVHAGAGFQATGASPAPVGQGIARRSTEQTASESLTRRSASSRLDPVLTPSGTHDLLLYADVGAALIDAAFHQNQLLSDPQAIRDRLADSKDEMGYPRFTAKGERHSGRGEFIVLLQPLRVGNRILPRARVLVSQRIGPAGQGDWRIESVFPVADDLPTLLPPSGQNDGPPPP
jgi:hypothetical protein